jgi:ADP-ribose pyrophosphatase YjhB (NUDIX family)
MANTGEIAQVFALVIDAAPSSELRLAASAVEFLYVFGTPARELRLSTSAVEFLYVATSPATDNTPVDPICVGFVPGPVWQMAARPAGQN